MVLINTATAIVDPALLLVLTSIRLYVCLHARPFLVDSGPTGGLRPLVSLYLVYIRPEPHNPV